jgi:hypothetical protein
VCLKVESPGPLVAGDALLGRISADVVAGELGAPRLTDLTPQEWLESTPLMRALRRRLQRE